MSKFNRFDNNKPTCYFLIVKLAKDKTSAKALHADNNETNETCEVIA